MQDPWGMTRPLLLPAVLLGCLAAACALNRPRVKSLRDDAAPNIQFAAPIRTTISDLNAMPSRCGPAGNHRRGDEELHVYEVVGRITRVKRERDHDVHVILADPARPADHMIVELEDPDYRGNAESRYRDALVQARRSFDALVAEIDAARLQDLKGLVVKVAGVGFFDMNHFQIGRSRSCLELHPVLSIELVEGS